MNIVNKRSCEFICCNCGKSFNGGEIIQGNFYCPMCASIIHANNSKSHLNNMWQYNFDDIPEACKTRSNHPSNGGSGICHCTLNVRKLY